MCLAFKGANLGRWGVTSKSCGPDAMQGLDRVLKRRPTTSRSRSWQPRGPLVRVELDLVRRVYVSPTNVRVFA